MSCDLCKREPRTRQYYEDSKLWIVDCDTCGVPLIIWKEHVMEVGVEDVTHMLQVIEKIFPDMGDGYYLDSEMRKIPEHKHWHLRKGRRWILR